MMTSLVLVCFALKLRTIQIENYAFDMGPKQEFYILVEKRLILYLFIFLPFLIFNSFFFLLANGCFDYFCISMAQNLQGQGCGGWGKYSEILKFISAMALNN
jgi:hypothetical protein